MKIKILQNYYCVCFVLANYCWTCGLPLTVVCRLCETSVEKKLFLAFVFCEQLKIGESFCVTDGCSCPLLPSVLGIHLA